MKSFVAMVLLQVVLPGLAFAEESSALPLTAAHARSAMTQFGCNGITALGVGPDNSYHGQCSKGGQLINVMMDKTGTVSQATKITHITEGQARYAMTEFGCANISSLGTGPGGTWHGQCYKGGQPVNVMVDGKGVASASTASHITESAARSMLTGFGCSNLSTLTMSMDGAWYGQCAKGGRTQNVSVDSTGKMASN